MIKYYLSLKKKKDKRLLLYISQTKSRDIYIGKPYGGLDKHTSFHKDGSLWWTINKMFKKIKLRKNKFEDFNIIFESLFFRGTFDTLYKSDKTKNEIIINFDKILDKKEFLQINIFSIPKSKLIDLLLNLKHSPDFILNNTDPTILIYFRFTKKVWRG